MVPGGRIELPLSCENQILSLARLPVPPSGLAQDIAWLAVLVGCRSCRSVITVIMHVNRVMPPPHLLGLKPDIDMAVVLLNPARRSAVAAQLFRS